MSTTVTLNGYIVVPAAELAAVQAELPNHIALTLAEPGCLSFSVTQDADNPLRYNVAEEFVDAAAFTQHQTRVRASYWGQVTANVARHYTITGMD